MGEGSSCFSDGGAVILVVLEMGRMLVLRDLLATEGVEYVDRVDEFLDVGSRGDMLPDTNRDVSIFRPSGVLLPYSGGVAPGVLARACRPPCETSVRGPPSILSIIAVRVGGPELDRRRRDGEAEHGADVGRVLRRGVRLDGVVAGVVRRGAHLVDKDRLCESVSEKKKKKKR